MKVLCLFLTILLYLNFIHAQSKTENNQEVHTDDNKEPKNEEFNLESFLKEIDDFECNNDLETADYKEDFNQLCDTNLEKAAFKEIGEFKEDGENFWNFIENKIYLPLAFEVPKSSSMSEMLK